ncbi:MAG TPA: hypothetical protein VMW83_16265 [Spirochaetia bacterium]|nr:hypothetical protein [Spirochaetia bacterium]
MGIYLGLEILPMEIEPGEWNDFYDQALELARTFPLPLQRFTGEERSGYHRFILTRNLESRDKNGSFFAITGDARTRQRAEQFMVYRDIEYYRRRVHNRPPKETGQDRQTAYLSDILFREHDSVMVFNEKTQTHCYHDLIWCLVTLAEDFFPGRACADGNLDAREWAHCRQWLAKITGKPIRKPLRLDAERLFHVLSQRYSGMQLVQKTEEKLRGKSAAIYRLLAAKNAPLLDAWTKNCLKENSPDTFGALFACFHILEGTGDLYALVKMACLDPDGPQWDLERVLSIAHAVGAFDPEPTATVRARSFLPAEFLPCYYRIRSYFEPEEASREIAGMVGIPVEKVRETLQKLQEERPVTLPRADEGNDVRTPGSLEIPCPAENIDFLRQEIARRGRNWDGPTLHGLIAPMAEKKSIVLTEETWQVIDREQDPAVLAGIIGWMVCCEGRAGEKAALELAFSHLAEIGEAWRNGRAWTCPADELKFDDGVWWVEAQNSAN